MGTWNVFLTKARQAIMQYMPAHTFICGTDARHDGQACMVLFSHSFIDNCSAVVLFHCFGLIMLTYLIHLLLTLVVVGIYCIYIDVYIYIYILTDCPSQSKYCSLPNWVMAVCNKWTPSIVKKCMSKQLWSSCTYILYSQFVIIGLPHSLEGNINSPYLQIYLTHPLSLDANEYVCSSCVLVCIVFSRCWLIQLGQSSVA